MELLKSKINIKYLWWFGLLLLLLFFHSSHTLNPDEGIILDGAWNLINGRVLYVDFVQYITPGSFYLIYWAWKIFGIHYQVANLLAILIVFLCAIGIYKISRNFNNSRTSFLTTLPFVVSTTFWPIINHNTFNLLFIIWSIYFFLKGLSSLKAKYIIISGLLTGLAILFLQHKGAILLFTLFIFLLFIYIKEKKRIWLKLNLLYLTFSLLPLIILIKWPLNLLYQYFFLIIYNDYRAYNQLPLYFSLFYVVFFLITFWLVREKKSKKINLLLFTQFVFLLLAILQRPDPFHLTLIIFPIYALLPLIFFKLKQTTLKIIILFYSTSGIIIFIILLSSITILILHPPFSIENRETINFIKANCHSSQSLYAGPFIPALYFETRKINPLPYYILAINSNDLTNSKHPLMQQYNNARNILEKNPPQCAVLNYKIVEKLGYDKNNPVDNFIKNNYKLVFTNKGLQVYKHNFQN